VDFFGADSTTINAPDVNPVENQQHHGAGPRQEGGRPQGKGSPRGSREDPPSRPPASTPSAASIYPLRRERPGRRSLEVSVDLGLAPRPQGFSPDTDSQGSPPDRSLRLSPIGADEALLFLERRGRPGSHRRTQPEVGLQAGLPLPSHSPPQEGYQEAGTVQGDVSPRHPVLGCPDVVCLSPSTSRGRCSLSSVQRRPHHRPDDRGASSKPGEALSSRLDDLRGYWGVNAVSDRSFRLISAGWKQFSEDCYERAWQSFKAFFRSSSIPFHQASLRNILDYLTHLYDCGLSWSFIGIHRSTISMMMAPIDGVRVGDHPLIKRLMSGVFNERPSRRANPELWDPLKVLSVFQHRPVSLPLSSLMRKGTFLMAIATAKKPSERVALLCDDNHFRWEGENLCFVPSRLTKTDRPGHLAPPFYVKPWKEDLCVCPVETVRLILLEHDRLRLQHIAIFFSWTFPHKRLDELPLNAASNFVSSRLASRLCQVQPGLSLLLPRWPVAPLLVMSYVSATGATL
jgi:hypothetical protein